jgi:hypothetical protein
MMMMISMLNKTSARHACLAAPMNKIGAPIFNTQLRFRRSNKTKLWGRPKAHKFLRGGFEGGRGPPRYHNQEEKDGDDRMRFQFKISRKMDEVEEANCNHLFELFNPEKVPTPDYTTLVEFEDHPFVQFCLRTTDEELDSMPISEIIKESGGDLISLFEVHFSLPIEYQDEIWDWVEREMHPELAKINPMEYADSNIFPTEADVTIDEEMRIWNHPRVREAIINYEKKYAESLTGKQKKRWLGLVRAVRSIVNDKESEAKEIERIFSDTNVSITESIDLLTRRQRVDRVHAYALKMWFEGLNEATSHADHARRYIEAYRAATTFTESDGDKMFELHKENPDYWTGDRLGAAFGISRDQAWAELLVREYDEAEKTGKPFCPEKVDYLFHRNTNALKLLQNRYVKNDKRSGVQFLKEATTGQVVDEDAIYKKFLEKTSKPISATGLDDDLPEWVRRPFQPPRSSIRPTKTVTEAESTKPTEESLRYPRIESVANLGTNTVRQRHRIIDMKSKSRINAGEQRKFLMLETDGTLRTMEKDTQEWITAKPLPYTRLGLGGKIKRRRLFRMREF